MFALEIQVLEAPQKLVIRLQDVMHLNSDKIKAVRDHLIELVKRHDADLIVVNLSEVTFCSSYTLNLLLWMNRALEPRAERIRLCELKSDTANVLQLTRIDKYFEVFTTESAALAHPRNLTVEQTVIPRANFKDINSLQPTKNP